MVQEQSAGINLPTTKTSVGARLRRDRQESTTVVPLPVSVVPVADLPSAIGVDEGYRVYYPRLPRSLARLVHALNNLPLWFFVRGARTILDVGCGVNSPVNYFVSRSQAMDGVDVVPEVLRRVQSAKYRYLYLGDVRTVAIPQEYDLITALDVLEHFTKDEGVLVLEKLERAGRRVIVVTPNGFVPQQVSGEPFQEHRSGWTAEDFSRRGYVVYGMFGPRWLRTGPAVVRFSPKAFWALVALLASSVYFWLPRRSFSLLAVYDKRDRHSTDP